MGARVEGVQLAHGGDLRHLRHSREDRSRGGVGFSFFGCLRPSSGLPSSVSQVRAGLHLCCGDERLQDVTSVPCVFSFPSMVRRGSRKCNSKKKKKKKKSTLRGYHS